MKNTRNAAILIEFVGMPGIGKTTLSKQLAFLYKTEGIYQVLEPSLSIENKNRLYRIIYKITKMVHYISIHPRDSLEIFIKIYNMDQYSVKDFIIVFIN